MIIDEPQLSRWLPRGWRDKHLRHMPQYVHEESVASVTARLSNMPGLVDVMEVKELKARLAAAGAGKNFVLQLGNADERFDDVGSGLVEEHVRNLESIHNYLALMLRMPVLPIGMVAGNYARTREQPTEVVDGVTMTAYYGDMVNENLPEPRARHPDASRMLLAYEASQSALRSIRYRRFRPFTSHEVANLHYEEALVRRAGMSDGFFASSAHLLWLEGLNLFAGSSHLEFLRGILNPIGLRIGAALTPGDLLRIYQLLNPVREPGKIVLVSSLGEDPGVLREFIRTLREAEAPVVWMCDPWWVHAGQHWESADQLMQAVTAEMEHTALLHASEGSALAGLRLEIKPSVHGLGRHMLDDGMGLEFVQALHVCSDFACAQGVEA